MIIHFLRIALRQLWKTRTYSLMNIAGLSIAIASSLILLVHIRHELSYDSFHKKTDRICRLTLGHIDDKAGSAVTSGAMAPDFAGDYPEIETYVRFKKFPSLVAHGNQRFYEDRLFYTDSTVFEVFDFPLAEGDPATVLDQPFSVVLTPAAVLKYFGDHSPIGQILRINDLFDFTVTGIIEEVPGNAHFSFDFLASVSSLAHYPDSSVSYWQLNSWFSHYYHTYLLLKREADADELASKLKPIAANYARADHFELYGRNMGLFLQPLSDIHLNPLHGELEPQGRRQNLYIFGIVALIILLIACSNYANLSTALALRRNSEIGIRKVLGEQKNALSLRVFLEAALVTSFAIVLALALTHLAAPLMSQITGKTFALDTSILPVLAGIGVIATLLGGVYPAYVGLSFHPVHIFRKDTQRIRGLTMNKGLIVLQYALATGLVICTFVVHRQLQYMQSQPLGMEIDQVVVIPTRGNPQVSGRYPVLETLLKQDPAVTHTTISELVPGQQVFGFVCRFEGQEEGRNYPSNPVGYDFFETYGMDMVAGRNFSRAIPTDTLEKAIINEALARRLGWTNPQEALQKRFDFGNDGVNTGEIIGVVRDAHFHALQQDISPMLFFIEPQFYEYISIRMQTTDADAALEHIEAQWSALFPELPFEYFFADAFFGKQYEADQRLATLFTYFVVLALLLAGIGLFGLSALIIGRRTKEIGIRKIAGATTGRITRMLTGEFLHLAGAAIVIAFPVSWYLMKTWLQSYAYRIEIQWQVFVVSAMVAFAVVILAVLTQSVKAAITNPVDALRSE